MTAAPVTPMACYCGCSGCLPAKLLVPGMLFLDQPIHAVTPGRLDSVHWDGRITPGDTLVHHLSPPSSAFDEENR